MTDIAEHGHTRTEVPGASPDHAVLATGEYLLPAADDRPSCTRHTWRVVVQVTAHLVRREVQYDGKPWSEVCAEPHRGHSSEVIWPTWPATIAEDIEATDSPLRDLLQHWDANISRLRDSAKWLAAVLGGGLASVIPTAQLGGLEHLHLTLASRLLGALGLLLVSITLLLILRVLRPQTVSFGDIQDARLPAGAVGWMRLLIRKFKPHSHAFEGALYRWQHTVQAHPDLYLPCGVDSLTVLRQLAKVEEVTLVALSRATETAASDKVLDTLTAAEAARAARLHDLRAAAATVVAIGTYYKVRARSTVASYWGVALGLGGLIAIIAAVT